MLQIQLKYNIKYDQNYPQSFTGKERDSETGFSYFGARYYDSDILTGWLSVDPMADKYPGLSPYAYCAWNPVKLVDPDGEEIWLPEITENGEISYVAEKGDTKETFTQQYNVSKEATDAIFENAGIDKVSKGTRISGDIIAKSVTNNTNRRYDDVLKLNWRESTDKQKIYHVMFAILSTHIRNRDSFVDLNQFLVNIPSSVGEHSCFKASGSFDIPLLNGETMDIEYFNAVICTQSSKIQANKFAEFERSDGSFVCRHEFVKYPKKGAPIQKIFIVFLANFSNIYDKTYNK
ncbi:MAG: RHS repeat-associated core domain-containing protein [Bacteroidales bacterium]|nr:RHS repeat-associated core domain-containing protein [Bacteroidales bacterium]